ncbi:hypothetical protein BCR44DRAFT_1443603 [Catenaria anguillulae PL171]|uniref:Ankyrin repeat-containing domain protein n=1 Tax=Catenaria anguillulae PL171 TaxID=765915 RepID=A0A1Y2H8R4_9FUNG|nr:hypothetical protein BCR44DRAFT_1443603 [Catenaria anguillulae PL171]
MELAGAEAIVAAAKKRHVNIMEWWFLQTQAGFFAAAFSGGHVAVLEWCGKQPPVMEAWLQQPMIDWTGVAVLEWCKSQPLVMHAWQQGIEQCERTGNTLEISSMCLSVVEKGHVLEWLYVFDLLPFAEGNSRVSGEACEQGQLELVKELHSYGYLMGSRKHLVQSALVSGKLELLEWIDANIDPSIPDVADWDSGNDLYNISQGVAHVDILDWLLANGFRLPAPGKKRANVFASAASYGRLDILEWLFTNGFAQDMTMEDWCESFCSASGNGHVNVLEWLAEHIPKTWADTANAPASPIPTNLLRHAFGNGQVDVIEWWAHKSGWLKDAYDLNDGLPYLNACDSNYESRVPSKLAALKVWVNAGYEVEYAECIQEASTEGRIDVLDWLLHPTRVSEADFIKAWSSNELPHEEDLAALQAHYGYDIFNHGGTLVWWRAKLPHIAALPINRGPYYNPIHAHFLQHMLGNTSFQLLGPLSAIKEFYGGQVVVAELEENADQCLAEASQHGDRHILDWWKESGLEMKCPEAILTGETRVRWRAKEWWAKSGLVDESDIARIQVR